MVFKSRVPQERRRCSRVVELLNCQFTHGDSTYSAVIVNLSQKGALLSSRSEVPIGSSIEITIASEDPGKKIMVGGKVMRSTGVATDHGRMFRFVIRFSYTPLDILKLLAKLNAK